MKVFFKIFIFLFLLTLSLGYYTPIVLGQTVQSNCVVTKIGSPQGEAILPQNCVSSSGTILYPPGMKEHPSRPGYFNLPISTDGSYQFYTCAAQTWGSKELVGVLYTVAQNWKKEYPGGYLLIGDLTAAGHKSHFWGYAVDLVATTNGRDRATDMNRIYNQTATIRLGQLLIDTGKIKNIWYNDPTVTNSVIYYANNLKNKPVNQPFTMKHVKGHETHFHVNVYQTPERLSFWDPWEPGCGTK